MTTGWILAIALSSVGVDYGWQPAEDGGTEYVIQLDQLAVDALIDGAEVTSAILPDAEHVRGFRIKVGKESLPRENGAEATSFEEADAAAASTNSKSATAAKDETVVRGQNAGDSRPVSNFQVQIPAGTSTLPSNWQTPALRAQVTPVSGQTGATGQPAQQPGVSLDSNGLQLRGGGYNAQLSLPAPPNTQSVLTTNNQNSGTQNFAATSQQGGTSPGPLAPPVSAPQGSTQATDGGWTRSQFGTPTNATSAPQGISQNGAAPTNMGQPAATSQFANNGNYQYVDPRTQQSQGGGPILQPPAISQPQMEVTPSRQGYEPVYDQRLNSPYATATIPRADAPSSSFGGNSSWGSDTRTQPPNYGSPASTTSDRFANNTSGSLFNPDGFDQRETHRPADYTQPMTNSGQAGVITPVAANGAATTGAAANGAGVPASIPANTTPATTPEQSRPWGTLMLVLVGFFASLGGNIYLGWIAWESYLRYRRVLIEGDLDSARRTRDLSESRREERY